MSNSPSSSQLHETLACCTCQKSLRNQNYCFRDGKYFCESHYQSLVAGSLKTRSTHSSTASSTGDFVILDDEESDVEVVSPSVRERFLGNSPTSSQAADTSMVPVTSIDQSQLPRESIPVSEPDAFNCDVCQEVVTMGVRILDRYYHPQCLCCTRCGKRIKLPNYGFTNDNIYCSKHFIKCMSKKYTQDSMATESSKVTPDVALTDVLSTCAACGRQTQECILLHEKFYHPDCVNCAICGKTVGTTRFMIHESGVVCGRHVAKHIKPARTGISQSALRNKAQLYNWTARQMILPFPSGNFVACFFCHEKLIVGIYELERYFHPWCFRCSLCHKRIEPKKYEVSGGEIFCNRPPCQSFVFTPGH